MLSVYICHQARRQEIDIGAAEVVGTRGVSPPFRVFLEFKALQDSILKGIQVYFHFFI